MLPIGDTIPGRNPPIAVWLLILANSLVFFVELAMPPPVREEFFYLFGMVPARYSHPEWARSIGFPIDDYWPFVTSMFLHSGWLHIGGNMLFLWIFGDNVEDFFGHIPYLFFYLVCGIGAGLLHVLFNLHSNIPAVGASGAVSGIMGAYILLYPRARILTLVFIFPLPVPAVIFLGLWYVMQFLAGLSVLGGGTSGGVAVWAHIGGFLLGMLLTSMARRR